MMSMISRSQPTSPFDSRRKDLGMPIAVLAKKGKISTATAKRILRGTFSPSASVPFRAWRRS